MPTNMHLTHETTQHGTPPESAALIVYAVHGRGQSPAFMAETADRVDLPGVAWILPEAHDSSWYPQGFLAPLEDNQPALDDALETVRAHLRPLLSRDGTPVVVLGFSQGACLLSEYLLRDQPRLAGVVLHTGGYLGPAERTWEPSPQGELSGQAVEMFTAQEDAWVPLHRVEATGDAFRSLGATVELTVYDDRDHHLNDDSVRMIRRYLQHRLASPGSR